MQAKVNQTAATILGNVTEFISFTTSGEFSVIRDAESTEFRLNVVSIVKKCSGGQSLIDPEIYLTAGLSTGPFASATNGTKLAYPISCSATKTKAKKNSQICDAWYYSEAFNAAFGLVVHSRPNTNLGDLSDSLFAYYRTPEHFFEAAYVCVDGNIPGPEDSFTFSMVPQRGLDFKCVSRIPKHSWDMTCRSTDQANVDPGADSKCASLHVPEKKGFWEAKGNARAVLAAYLGPALTQGKLKITMSKNQTSSSNIHLYAIELKLNCRVVSFKTYRLPFYSLFFFIYNPMKET